MSAPGGSNFQPESLAELSRFVQYMFAGMDKQLNEITSKLDRMEVVSKEQHRSDMDDLKEELREQKQEFEEKIRAQDQELEDYQNKLSSYGRWFVSSLIIPLAGLIVTIYGLFNGGS